MLLIIELLFITLLSMVLFMLYRSEHLSARHQVPTASLMEYWGGKERRQSVRFRKTLGVSYVIEKRAHLSNSGKTLDISDSGLRLSLEEKLVKGTIIDMRISDPSSNKTIEIEGEVIWSEDTKTKKDEEDSGKRRFEAGLKFLGTRSPLGIAVSDFIRSLNVNGE